MGIAVLVDIICLDDAVAVGDGHRLHELRRPRERWTSPSPVATPSAGLVGNNHTCALRASGAVACWSNNIDGQLGNGSNTTANAPTLVAELSMPKAFDG